MNGRMMGTILALLVLALSLPALAGAEETLYVKKVENLPEDFIFGMDISSVLAEEASGVRYYDFDGRKTDLFRLLADMAPALSVDAVDQRDEPAGFRQVFPVIFLGPDVDLVGDGIAEESHFLIFPLFVHSQSRQ